MRGEPPEASYTFKHALVRDAAYESLLKSRRRQLHARIAAVLEERFPETAGTAPELLAHHWAKAGSPSRAVELWIVAANRALALASNREAAAFLERALAALGEQEETRGTLREMIDVRRLLHQALYPVGELRRTRANLAEAERLAECLDDPVRLCRVLSSETYLLATSGDLKEAIHVGERALSLLDRGGDDLEGAVNTRLMLARTLYAAGRYRKAIDHIRPVVETLREDVPRGQLGPGLNQTINARVWHMLCLAELGEFTACAALAAEVQRLAARVESAWQLENQVWLRIAVGRAAVLRGEFVQRWRLGARPGAQRERVHHLLFPGRLLAGHCPRPFGGPRKGLGAAARGGEPRPGDRLRLPLRAAARPTRRSSPARRGRCGRRSGRWDAGPRGGTQRRREGQRGLGVASPGRCRGTSDQPGAVACYREALEIAERLGMAPLRTRCLEASGGLLTLAPPWLVNNPG